MVQVKLVNCLGQTTYELMVPIILVINVILYFNLILKNYKCDLSQGYA